MKNFSKETKCSNTLPSDCEEELVSNTQFINFVYKLFK